MRSLMPIFFAATTLVGADLNPFVGAWKEDTSLRSGPKWKTLEIRWPADGVITRIFNNEFVDTIRLDGQERVDELNPNVMSTWTEVDSRTWRTQDKVDGRHAGTRALQVSSDGTTLIMTVEDTLPNGQPTRTAWFFERIGGGDGMFGTWNKIKTEQTPEPTPEVIRFEQVGKDRIHVVRSSTGVEYTASVDGHESAISGASGHPVSLKMVNDRTIEATVRTSSKVDVVHTFSVSADGKELIETIRMPSIPDIKCRYVKK